METAGALLDRPRGIAADEHAPDPDPFVAAGIHTPGVAHAQGPSTSMSSVVQLQQVTEQARHLATRIAADQAQLTALVGAMHSLGTPDTTTAAWVAWQLGMVPTEAHRLVRLAQRLPELPGITEAFAAGALSEGTTDLLSGIATPQNEAVLLRTAQAATGAQLVTLARHFKRQRPQPDKRAPRSAARWFRDDDGNLRLTACLVGPEGHEIEAILRNARWEGGAPDTPTEPQFTNAETLGRVVRGFAAAQASGPHAVLPEQYQVVVHVDADEYLRLFTDDPTDPLAEALAGATAHPAAAGHVHGGPALERWMLEQALCDGTLCALVTHHGTPLGITVPQRLATPPQRRALAKRDQVCIWPGCGRHWHLVPHHIVYSEHDGPTALRNLALLCTTHHHRVHREGIRITVEGPGRFHLATANGEEIGRTNPRPPTPDRGAPPTDRERYRGCGERATAFAKDVLLEHWLHATGPPGTST